MLETLRSRPPGARPAPARVRGGLRRSARRRARLGGLERHRRPAPGDPRGGDRARRRGRHDAVQLRRLGQLPALRGRAAGLLRHRPAHAQHRSRGGRGRRSASARPGCCRCTSSATRPTCRRSSGSRAERGLWLVEDACEALGAVHADGTPVGARGNLVGVRLLPEQAADDGGGGRRDRRLGRRSRSASTPSATRAARPTWAGSTTTGSASTTASTTSPARSASRSSSASTRCSPPARASPALYTEALGRGRGPRRLPCPDADGDRAQLVRLRGPAAARRRSRRGRHGAARARRGLQAVPARDPPDELLPRALRPPRGRVPGLRGRRRAARWRCRSSRS